MCERRFPGAVLALALVLVAGTTEAHARVWGAGGQVLNPSTSGVAGTPNDNELFGARLASGDFDGDGFADVAVDALGETVSAATSAGAVHVFYGSRSNFGVADDQRIAAGQDGIPGASESNGQFGWALAVGDFDGNGFDDLAIGTAIGPVGAIQLLRGALFAAGFEDGNTLEWGLKSP